MKSIPIGLIYAWHRKSLKINSQLIAEQSNISRSNLSEFENGKREFSEDRVQFLYSLIGLNYENKHESEKKLKDIVLKLYHNICFNREYENIIDEHHKMKSEVQCTSSYLIWILGEFIYHSFNPNSFYEYQQAIHFLEMNNQYLDDNFRQMLYDCIALYYKKKLDYKKAMLYFRKGLDITCDENVEAMIRYHKSLILVNTGYLFEALSHLKKAKRLFDKNLNFHKDIMCSTMMGVAYSRLGNYKQAEKIYLQCIEAGELIHYPREKQLITYNNLMWNYVISEQFDKVIECKDIVKDIASEDSDIYSYISYSYWKLGSCDNAKKALSKAKKYMDTEADSFFISALNSILLQKQFSTLEKKLLLLYDSAIKEYDYQMQLFAMKLLVHFSEKYCEVEKQVIYMKNVIEILEKIH